VKHKGVDWIFFICGGSIWLLEWIIWIYSIWLFRTRDFSWPTFNLFNVNVWELWSFSPLEVFCVIEMYILWCGDRIGPVLVRDQTLAGSEIGPNFDSLFFSIWLSFNCFGWLDRWKPVVKTQKFKIFHKFKNIKLKIP
jgi:hypothetical protein